LWFIYAKVTNKFAIPFVIYILWTALSDTEREKAQAIIDDVVV